MYLLGLLFRFRADPRGPVQGGRQHEGGGAAAACVGERRARGSGPGGRARCGQPAEALPARAARGPGPLRAAASPAPALSRSVLWRGLFRASFVFSKGCPF